MSSPELIELYEQYIKASRSGVAFHSGLYDKVHAAWTEIKARYTHVQWRTIGDEVGVGWWPILEELLSKIDATMAGQPGYVFTVRQIKEKFGGLRFYYELRAVGEDEEYESERPEDPLREELSSKLYGFVREAEDKADKTCEWCGEPGKRGGDGWIVTLCDKHHEMNKRE